MLGMCTPLPHSAAAIVSSAFGKYVGQEQIDTSEGFGRYSNVLGTDGITSLAPKGVELRPGDICTSGMLHGRDPAYLCPGAGKEAFFLRWHDKVLYAMKLHSIFAKCARSRSIILNVIVRLSTVYCSTDVLMVVQDRWFCLW